MNEKLNSLIKKKEEEAKLYFESIFELVISCHNFLLLFLKSFNYQINYSILGLDQGYQYEYKQF